MKIYIYLIAVFSFFVLISSVTLADPVPCNIFPTENIWNTPIDKMPLDPNSDTYVQTIGATKTLHPDFGAGEWNGAPIGIPYVLVPGTQPKVKVTFDYPDESDQELYPVPPNAPIEGGYSSTGDRHILMIDKDNCRLYELYSSYPNGDGTWKAGSGAIFDLNSNNLRTDTWTSADAAGLPIYPGLMNYEDIVKGEINHAIRFTVPQTQKKYLWPARHYASSLTDKKYPPMGQYFRLKSTFDTSGYSKENQIILKALKKYGMILADNGSAWYISGIPDPRWNDDDLNKLKALKGSDFEAVDVSSLMIDKNSGLAKQDKKNTPPVLLKKFGTITMKLNDPTNIINLKEYFKDAETADLTYYISYDNHDIADISGDNTIKGQLNITPKAIGSTRVTIFGDDTQYTVGDTFNVVVEKALSVDDLNSESFKAFITGTGSKKLIINGYFNYPGYLSIEVYNILGQQISELISGDVDRGSFSQSINIDDLKFTPSGYYFVRISLNGISKAVLPLIY